jgi:hypothetical protein
MAVAVAAPNDDNGRRGYDRQVENNESQHQPKEKNQQKMDVLAGDVVTAATVAEASARWWC